MRIIVIKMGVAKLSYGRLVEKNHEAHLKVWTIVFFELGPVVKRKNTVYSQTKHGRGGRSVVQREIE